MKRKPRFKARVKSENSKTWVEGYVFYDGDDCFIQDLAGEKHEVIEETVCRCSDLYSPVRDKGFNEAGDFKECIPLYENDIVEFYQPASYSDSYKMYSIKEGDRFVCYFSGGGFRLVPEDMVQDWEKIGRAPSLCRVMRTYDVWNNHGYFLPVGNLYDE